ncbi:MAG TPA: methyl-accepting chemotaxis protein, partial [Longimicrobium sp.]|nr:methyl-accepting chemotaxis protein [Longimicrobium sp.]
MSESSPITTNYAQFYARQSRPVGDLGRLALAAPALLLFVLVVILVFLRSPWYVWGYIVLLWLVAVWGFQRLRTALAVTSAAVAHLELTASHLGGQPTRDQFLEFLRRNSSPDDLSNVPEAIISLSSGQMSGESIRVAANTSFAHPTSELNFAAYVRNAMVLGGLFGTVLFFALELGGTAFQEGNLGELLPGLRGALASTLTGILGSLSLGLVATRIEHHLAQLVWETEAFISGPVAAALAATPQKRSLRTEVDLWESLREEVARMADGTAQAYGRLGDDIHGHARALGELSRQIGDLPAVQLPPELARLGTAIDQFTHGTDVLAKTSRVLVEAVAALGVFAPARLLTDVEQLATASAQRDTVLADGMTTLAARVSALGSRVDDIHQRVGVPDRLWESLSALDAATRRNGEQIARLAEEVRAKQDVGAVTGAVQQAVASVQSLEGGLATFQGRISTEVDRLASASSALDGSAAEVRGAVDQLSTVSATVAKAAPELQKQAARLAEAVDRTQQQEKTLQRVESRLRPLDGVYAWHERAMRAPLMRLLTLPLWRAWRREPEPPVRIVRREAPAAAPPVAADHQLGPATGPAPAASLDVAPQLYRRWCLDGTPPRIPESLETSFLRYAGNGEERELAPPVHLFADDPQVGEFVRFSPRGAGLGVAFPNPAAYFSAAVHRILHPDLT